MQSNVRSNPLCSRSEGISLVELVVVITLLGMLCAFAIPAASSEAATTDLYTGGC
jgi:Tfp pilus assembly protein FimT